MICPADTAALFPPTFRPELVNFKLQGASWGFSSQRGNFFRAKEYVELKWDLQDAESLDASKGAS